MRKTSPITIYNKSDQNMQTLLSQIKQEMSQFFQKLSPSFHRFYSHPVFLRVSVIL